MSTPTSNHPARLEFDSARLETYLREAVPGLTGPMRLQRIGGGQSNPTFFVDFDNRSMVLRKQPPGQLLPSAHAVDREARIMQALAATDVPVPKIVLFETDRSIVGTPFYVMDTIKGRVFAEYALPDLSAGERRAMYLSMAETMAKLHRVDWQAIGLEGFGKPGNFFQRQVARWSRQWQDARVRDNPWLDQLIAWLPANIPGGEATTICHGDFRMGNLMFHPTEPRVIAVLDWELSTLGHPLADVAYNCLAWRTLPSEYGGILGLDHEALGIPSEADYLQHYQRFAGPDVAGGETVAIFHYVFSLFRFAVIFEGIAARAAAGNANADNAASVGHLGIALAKRAVALIESASEQPHSILPAT
ncbi:MAG: phosphotransferase family protein [Pseudomonadota bacterium]